MTEEIENFKGMRLYPHQRLACKTILAGGDVLLVSPTGSGKSLCYLLPTHLKKKSTLVVSPLIALMDDQVEQAKSQGFRAAALHSGVSADRQWRILSQWMIGNRDLLLISPERLANEKIIRTLKVNQPGLMVIDEAHCVETWGKRFRPMYQELVKVIKDMRPAPVLAMTATATPDVQEKISYGLGLRRPEKIRVPFLFPNISLAAIKIHKLGERLGMVLDFTRRPHCLPMVIFCQTKGQAEKIVLDLLRRNLKAEIYHGGKDVSSRKLAQSAFSKQKDGILVTTSAFEMGVHISGIRTAIHFGLPLSLSSYVQGVGRIGRDGAEAQAIILFCESDLDRLDYMLTMGSAVGQELASESRSVEEMYKYAMTSICRVVYLNRYFFQDCAFEKRPCGRCDNCQKS